MQDLASSVLSKIANQVSDEVREEEGECNGKVDAEVPERVLLGDGERRSRDRSRVRRCGGGESVVSVKPYDLTTWFRPELLNPQSKVLQTTRSTEGSRANRLLTRRVPRPGVKP